MSVGLPGRYLLRCRATSRPHTSCPPPAASPAITVIVLPCHVAARLGSMPAAGLAAAGAPADGEAAGLAAGAAPRLADGEAAAAAGEPAGLPAPAFGAAAPPAVGLAGALGTHAAINNVSGRQMPTTRRTDRFRQ